MWNLSLTVTVGLPEKSRFFHSSLILEAKDCRGRRLLGKRQREKTLGASQTLFGAEKQKMQNKADLTLMGTRSPVRN